jgi:hypothetical protein
MQNARIVPTKGLKTCKEVLIFIYRCRNGNDHVRLVAWHDHTDGPFIQEGTIKVDSDDDIFKQLCRIVEDYSTESATDFAKSFRV